MSGNQFSTRTPNDWEKPVEEVHKRDNGTMIHLTIKHSVWLWSSAWACFCLVFVFVLFQSIPVLGSTGMLWNNYGKILIYPCNIEDRIETFYIAISTVAPGFQKFFIFGVVNISSFIWATSEGVRTRRESYDSVSLEVGSIQPWEENAQGTLCCYVQLHGQRIQRCPGSSWSFTTVGLATTNPSWKMENSL